MDIEIKGGLSMNHETTQSDWQTVASCLASQNYASCEALEEAAENILPTRFVEHTLFAHLTLETYPTTIMSYMS